MTATKTMTCGHCGTKTASRLIGAVKSNKSDVSTSGQSRYYWDVLSACTGCARASLITVATSSNLNQSIQSSSNSNLNNVIFIKEQWPSKPSVSIPSHLPKDVSQVYDEAVRLFHLRVDGVAFFEPSMHSFRRALDLATKDLTGSDKHIRVRIKQLLSEGKIPETLSDLAHQIRIGGNDASHDAPLPSDQAEAQAGDLAEFTELFLTYTYSLPKRIDERNIRAAQRNTTSGEEVDVNAET